MKINEVLTTEVRYECDTVVCGGGASGTAAALSALREGNSVILIEREYMTGGLATAGLVNIYLPLDDGMGHQVSFGIAEELLKLAMTAPVSKNSAEELRIWTEKHTAEERAEAARFKAEFNPWIYAVKCEQLLIKNGIRLLYGATVCGVVKNGSLIEAVICEGKDGRFAVKTSAVVDATGDADIAYMAGEETVINESGNPVAAWYGVYDGKNAPGIKTLGVCDSADGSDGMLLSSKRSTGIGPEALTEMTFQSHKYMLLDFEKIREGCDDAAISCIPVIPQVRMTRMIKGRDTLEADDDHRDRAQSVGLIGAWNKRGPAYAIPLGALSCMNTDNLFAAGRCISVCEDVWDFTRVIPACAVTGEAAGAAAALFAAKHETGYSAVRKVLSKRGIPLEFEDITG